MTMTTLYFIVTLPRLLLYMLLYHWIILNGIILYSNFIHFTTDKTSFYYLSTVRIKRILHNLKNMSMMSSNDATSWFFKAMKNLLDFSLSNITITYNIISHFDENILYSTCVFVTEKKKMMLLMYVGFYLSVPRRFLFYALPIRICQGP